MTIHTIRGPITVTKPKDYPEERLPEFLFAGRSNVGKSSLINKILNRKNLAYTSQNPGKTQTVNFYTVNDAFTIVDVPGYGYARVSKVKRAEFAEMIELYLTTRTTLKRIFMLVDARHKPSEDDVIMSDFLHHYGIPFTVLATKADKVKQGQRAKARKLIRETLGLDAIDDVRFVSVMKEEGIQKLRETIFQESTL
ncbi:MAG: ribosome biogenesis GTP-binding protein YihA/YsxC [Candidatus Izemoplasmataceae bacterium]